MSKSGKAQSLPRLAKWGRTAWLPHFLNLCVPASCVDPPLELVITGRLFKSLLWSNRSLYSTRREEAAQRARGFEPRRRWSHKCSVWGFAPQDDMVEAPLGGRAGSLSDARASAQGQKKASPVIRR